MRKEDAVNRWVGRCGLCKGELKICSIRLDSVVRELMSIRRGCGRQQQLTQLECVECRQTYLVTRSPAYKDNYNVQALGVN